jgi:hypothetical protein
MDPERFVSLAKPATGHDHSSHATQIQDSTTLMLGWRKGASTLLASAHSLLGDCSSSRCKADLRCAPSWCLRFGLFRPCSSLNKLPVSALRHIIRIWRTLLYDAVVFWGRKKATIPDIMPHDRGSDDCKAGLDRVDPAMMFDNHLIEIQNRSNRRQRNTELV